MSKPPAAWDDSEVQPTVKPSQNLRVTVVITILNEARTLGETFRGLVAQDYPHRLLDILIVDCQSTDRWREHLTILADAGLQTRVLTCPVRNTSKAVNMAIEASDSPRMLWISGHCRLSPDYVTKAVSEAALHENVVTGGSLEVAGVGFAGRVNAMILQSRFGTGTAPWRFRKHPGWVSSVTYALYDRAQLARLGGLDERLIRNQDTDLMARLRRDGTRFRMVDACAEYIAPATFGAFWRRAWGNGAWTVWGSKLGWAAASWYHFTPMLAVLVAGLLLVLSVWSIVPLLLLGALIVLYAAAALIASLGLAIRNRCFWAPFVLPIFLFAHHVVYGAGALSALLRPPPDPPGV